MKNISSHRVNTYLAKHWFVSEAQYTFLIFTYDRVKKQETNRHTKYKVIGYDRVNKFINIFYFKDKKDSFIWIAHWAYEAEFHSSYIHLFHMFKYRFWGRNKNLSFNSVRDNFFCSKIALLSFVVSTAVSVLLVRNWRIVSVFDEVVLKFVLRLVNTKLLDVITSESTKAEFESGK